MTAYNRRTFVGVALTGLAGLVGAAAARKPTRRAYGSGTYGSGTYG